jgi:hypothetical protein
LDSRFQDAERIAEALLTELAIEAFRAQIRISGFGPWLFPSEENPTGHQITLKTVRQATLRRAKVPYFWIWIQPLASDGKPGGWRPFPYLQTPFEERNASISPDGNWIVYSSDETGRTEVYAQAFPSPGGKVQISTGGERPRRTRGGKEVFFIAPDRKMTAAF